MLYLEIGKKIPNMERKVSIRQLERYPHYLNFLLSLRNSGVTSVTTSTIAKAMGNSEEQVRKDFQIFTRSYGKPGCARKIDILIEDLKEYLGYNKTNNAIVVGVGNLGNAFMSFGGFDDFGLKIIAGLDVNPEVVGKSINGKTVYSIYELNKIVQDLNIDIAILTTPKNVAQEVATKLSNSGIKAIWNFVPVRLDVENVIVENVELASSLAVLAHKLNESKGE